MRISPTTGKAIVLNLGDGLTTSLSFLLPMILFGGHLNSKAMLIGAVGGSVSMAFNLDDSENGAGSRSEFIAAFLSSLLGGVLPVLSFMAFSEPWAGIVGIMVVLIELATLTFVKKISGQGWRLSVAQVVRSTVPALVIVAALSLIH